MAGRFEGLSDLEWRLCVDIMPPEPTKRRRGMPHTPFRQVVNTLLGGSHPDAQQSRTLRPRQPGSGAPIRASTS